MSIFKYFYYPTPLNWRKLKINPLKYPSKDQDIDQEEQISVIKNKNKGIKVRLYNILEKKI